MSLLNSTLALSLVVFSAVAHAAPAAKVLQLECRIDNSVISSDSRKIELRDGMLETIDCQTHTTCKNSIYQITMNYNSLYEKVSVSITDTETKKGMQSDHVLAPNKTGNKLKNALLDIGYGDLVTDMSEIPAKNALGRFLVISCERLN